MLSKQGNFGPSALVTLTGACVQAPGGKGDLRIHFDIVFPPARSPTSRRPSCDGYCRQAEPALVFRLVL